MRSIFASYPSGRHRQEELYKALSLHGERAFFVPMKNVLAIKAASANHKPFGKKNFFFRQLQKASVDIPLDLIFMSESLVDMKPEFYRLVSGSFVKMLNATPSVIWVKDESATECSLYSKKMLALAGDKMQFFAFQQEIGLAALPTMEYRFDYLTGSIKDWKSIVIKPRNGRKGDGLIALTKQETQYELMTNDGSETLTGSQLQGRMRREVTCESIIQKRADATTLYGQPFDIRVIVQQRKANDFYIAASCIRISGNGLTSNIAQGGAALPLESIALLSYMGKTFDQLKSEVSSMCIYTAKCMASKCGQFPEVGFDILLDRKLGPVILEANANVGKWAFVKLADLYPKGSYLQQKHWSTRMELLRTPLVYVYNEYFSEGDYID